MRTTTKQDLIDRVAQATEQRRLDVKRTISKFLDLMAEELASGNRIEFREFGVFENRCRKGRTAQNPRTGESVAVPPRRTVKFKVSLQVRERLEAASAARAADDAADKNTGEISGVISNEVAANPPQKQPVENGSPRNQVGTADPSRSRARGSDMDLEAKPNATRPTRAAV